MPADSPTGPSDAPEETPDLSMPPSVWRALRFSFWDFYDHIGYAMLANLLWTLSIAMVAIPAGYHPMWGLIGLASAPAGMGMTVAVGRLSASGDEFNWNAAWKLGLSLWRRMFVYMMVGLTVTGLGALNLNFYLGMAAGPQPKAIKWAFVFALGLTVWMLVAFLLMHVYLPAFLSDGRSGIWKAYKRAFLSVAGYPGKSLAAGACLLLLFVLSLVSVFGMGIVFVSFYGLFSAHMAAMVSGEGREETDYEHRSLRELLPWTIQQ